MKVKLPSNTVISNMCVSDSIRNRQHVSVEAKIKVRFNLLRNTYQMFYEFVDFKVFLIKFANYKMIDVNMKMNMKRDNLKVIRLFSALDSGPFERKNVNNNC